MDHNDKKIVGWLRKDLPLTAAGKTTIIPGGIHCLHCRFPEMKSDIPIYDTTVGWKEMICVNCSNPIEMETLP